jgi:hypothetical protein
MATGATRAGGTGVKISARDNSKGAAIEEGYGLAPRGLATRP